MRRIAAGDVLRVRVCRGQSVAMLDARAGELAACLRVRELRVEPERGDAAIARVTLVRRDAFDDPAPLTWPETDAEERSLWDLWQLDIVFGPRLVDSIRARCASGGS